MKPKLRTILDSFWCREDPANLSHPDHKDWAETAEGAAEIRYLAKHLFELNVDERKKVTWVIAMTGVASAVPLVLAGLGDSSVGNWVAAGVRTAAFFGTDAAFRSAVAPAMVGSLPRNPRARRKRTPFGFELTENAVIEALPKLDRVLATQILATPEWLRPGSRYAFAVFKSFNAVSLALPLEPIIRWLARWEKAATGRSYDHFASYAYKEGLFALALHRPTDAIEKAERLMARRPGFGSRISEIYLSVHGLANLYQRLCDHSDTPKVFASLPLCAKVFFWVHLFAADCDNGGMGQALGNSTGNSFRLVLQGCRLIGDERAVRFLSAVSVLFGPSGPSQNRDKRNRQMDAIPNFDKRVDKIPLGKWSWDVTRLHLHRYAAKHAEILRGIATTRRI